MDFQKTLNECRTVVDQLFDLLIRMCLDNNKMSESDQNELAKCKMTIGKVSQELKSGGYKHSVIQASITLANELIEEIERAQ